jgi:uncharacterized protein (TIGR02246 family)
MMLRRFCICLALLGAFAAQSAGAAVPDDIRALYQRFYTAQNAHDLKAVGESLWDSPDFLWVSDGKSIWGRDKTLQRMGNFQSADVWRAEPNLQDARVVEVNDGTAYLHLTLDLVIGAKDKPDRFPFLVSMLCARTNEGWKIMALFTTTPKPE